MARLSYLQRSFVVLPLVTLTFFAISSQRIYAPLFAKEVIGSSAVEAGLIASAYGAVGLIMGIPSGLASDRFGRKKLMFVGVLLLGTASILFSTSSVRLQVLLFHMMAGLGVSLFDPSIDATIGDMAKEDKIGRAYGLYQSFLSVGVGTGPLAMGLIITLIDFRLAFVVMAGIAFSASLLILTFFPKSNPQTQTKEIVKSSLRLGSLAKNKSVVAGWLLTTLGALMVFGITTFLPLYGRIINISPFVSGLAVSIILMVAAFSRIPFGRIVDKSRNPVKLVLSGFMILSTASFLIALNSSVLYFLGVTVLYGLGFGLTGIVGIVLIARSTSSAERGTAMGVLGVCRNAGFTLGPTIVASTLALLGENVAGYTLAFFSLGMIGIVGVIALYLIIRNITGK